MIKLIGFFSLVIAALVGPAIAQAEAVQSTTSVYVSLRDCIAADTACDSVGKAHETLIGGQPGGQEAQGRLDDPAFGSAHGSARLTGGPGAAMLTGSVRALAGKRNASSNYAVQRYSNDTGEMQSLALSATLVFSQTVPEDNARFPGNSGAQTRSLLNLYLWRMDVDTIEVGSSARENYTVSSARGASAPGLKLLDSFSNQTSAPDRTGEDEQTFWLLVDIEPGDSVWMFAQLQVFAANGAVADAQVTTRLEVDGPDRSVERDRQGGRSLMTNPTLIGILGLCAIAACWFLAAVLFRTGAPGSMSRMLGLLLVIEGLTLVTAGFPQFALGIHEHGNMPIEIALAITHWLSDGVILALYPTFLAAALQTGLTRPFARKGVRIALWIYAMGVVVGAVVLRGVFNNPVGGLVLYASMMLLFVYALLAAIDAWRRAEPGLAKTRAKIFVIAFGIRDIGWGFVYGASAWMTLTENWSYDSGLFWEVKFVYALSTLIAVPLIAYGILRSQLFDIDLKVRWTIKQSTFAVAVLLITFVVSEGVEMLVAAELGDKWGLVAAGVAVLLLKPLQAVAERVVSIVMPNTQNTPGYRHSRKTEVYGAAFAEAAEEGGISRKERALLDRLRDSLELTSDEASAIETKVMS